MSNTNPKKTKAPKSNKEINVLYQNLGGKVYAFTEINGQIFFGKVAIHQSTKDDVKKTSSQKEREAVK